MNLAKLGVDASARGYECCRGESRGVHPNETLFGGLIVDEGDDGLSPQQVLPKVFGDDDWKYLRLSHDLRIFLTHNTVRGDGSSEGEDPGSL